MADSNRIGEAIRIAGTVAGTTVVRNRPANVLRVVIPTTKTGTASLYDVATGDGTAATNFLMDVQNTAGSVPHTAELGFAVKRGLVAVTGGTTDFLVVVE